MRFFLTSLRLEARRGLLSRVTIAFIVILPLCVLALAGLFSGGAPNPLSAPVAIAHDADDDTAALIAAALPEPDGIRFVILQSPDPDELSRMVATGELECAYIIPADLKQRMLSGEVRGAVEVLASPGTVMDALAGKWVFAAIIEALAPEITAFELAAILSVPAEEILPEILHGFEQYAGGHRFVTTEVSWSGGGAEAAQPAPGLISAGRIMHGAIALAVLGAVFASLPGYLVAKEKMHSVLRPKNLCIYYGTVYIALFLRIALIGVAGLLAMGYHHLAPLAAYALFCAALGLLLALVLRPGASAFVIGVFAILCCTLLGGVIIDPAELGGVFAVFSEFLPTTHYIGAVV